MFTGIIQEVGTVVQCKRNGGGMDFTVSAPRLATELQINDSISVNGACQTVVAKSFSSFTVQAVEETLKKTTLGSLKESSPVNLELPLRLSDRLGGHLVLGHVDGVGQISNIEKQENSWLITVTFPETFGRYLIAVGSVAVDGISLTVAGLDSKNFVASIIPHTLQNTTLSKAGIGTEVNLEFDVIGKYMESLLKWKRDHSEEALTWEKLANWGYGT
ncbi:MAG: riboflavin synthase [Bacteroidota bacterium]